VAPRLAANDVPGLIALDDEYARLVDAVLPATVRVDTLTAAKRLVTDGYRIGYQTSVTPGLGSGVIISAEGHVVTNYHVIKGAQQVTVMTNDQKEYTAHVIDASEVRDIALLKIESDHADFPALTFGDSNKVRTGQIVFAVGNPFGLSGTVTQGIISARDRVQKSSETTLDFLQTDTVINPGNSGGPLINVRGEIIGINTMIFGRDVSTWQGVGFAVPSNTAKSVVETIKYMHANDKSVKRQTTKAGYLGFADMETRRITTGVNAGKTGVCIGTPIPGSPAEKAEFKRGDIITKFNGRYVKTVEELRALIQLTAPGTKVIMEVSRDGEEGTIDAVIGEASEPGP
jgi:S1-C subfamily serine protease